MSKHGNVKTMVDGITFASKAEARRYLSLRHMKVGLGVITDLEMQVPYVLAPSVKLAGDKRVKPALRYVADFRYRTQLGEVVVEDVKGQVTQVFRIKQHLMKSIHNIDIRIVK